MCANTVFVICDQVDAAESLEHGLKRRGIAVTIASPHEYATTAKRIVTYDLMVVDIHTFDQGSFFLCQQLRKAFDGPILVFTYEQGEEFPLRLYQQGIDESISKPIGISLALAKVTAWLRRTTRWDALEDEISYEQFHLDPNRGMLTMPDGRTIKLSQLEQRLAAILLRNSGQVLSSEILIEKVWADYGVGYVQLLKNLVYRLRRKIETDPKVPHYVETVPGRGYRLCIDSK